MRLIGNPDAILDQVRSMEPDVEEVLRKAYACTQRGKQEVYAYQGAALYTLARSFNRPGATFLEIGTYWGFSAAILAQAAPQAHIITLNPKPWEHQEAQKNLMTWSNVHVFCQESGEYLETYPGSQLDFIFVDGDHKRIGEDLPWWNWLRSGGLMLFHDYSPNGSGRPCPPVYRALEGFAHQLGRPADVLIVDDKNVGMAGWYRHTDENWNE